ncbi:3-hydroxybutyryl-CoA dehydratase [Lampropedia hyalina DSM 16112]|jgi:3-hydroxybutyryl-CoA dehydratase|uniref:3-hydroxybutyryl-CoA dehydratase n=1 Tax=Lampropedia hyalina DSM 16112 TaxID=1122156 RepID=A0A1M5AQA2_9BURK|nr:MaoC family dehydratase [Lampropedia hyalina]SHF32354.1 3-hydroxybutyryl-CoA dehydratase [Lampropedia hyalina DSM 16112]
MSDAVVLEVPRGVPIEEIKPGMSVSRSQLITDADIQAFAAVTGDRNPVHLSDEYAASTQFGKRIAHGILSAGFFSALFGMELPGPGCIYISQSVKFKRPVYIGDTVVATVKVVSVDMERRRVLFETVGTVNDRAVVTGEAELYIPEVV